jgi:hypothetical protein
MKNKRRNPISKGVNPLDAVYDADDETASEPLSKIAKALRERFDAVSKRPDHVMARKAFYYSHGQDPESFANQVSSELKAKGIDHVILDKGRVDKPFQGGASVANQSHFWAKVGAASKAAEDSTSSLEEAARAHEQAAAKHEEASQNDSKRVYALNSSVRANSKTPDGETYLKPYREIEGREWPEGSMRAREKAFAEAHKKIANSLKDDFRRAKWGIDSTDGGNVPNAVHVKRIEGVPFALRSTADKKAYIDKAIEKFRAEHAGFNLEEIKGLERLKAWRDLLGADSFSAISSCDEVLVGDDVLTVRVTPNFIYGMKGDAVIAVITPENYGGTVTRAIDRAYYDAERYKRIDLSNATRWNDDQKQTLTALPKLPEIEVRHPGARDSDGNVLRSSHIAVLTSNSNFLHSPEELEHFHRALGEAIEHAKKLNGGAKGDAAVPIDDLNAIYNDPQSNYAGNGPSSDPDRMGPGVKLETEIGTRSDI